MPHRTCGCAVNSPHNRTCTARPVNVWQELVPRMPHRTCGCVVNWPYNPTCGPRAVPYGILPVILTDSSGNWQLFCSFRSSACAIHQCPIPLPPCGVLDHPENKSRQYPHQQSPRMQLYVLHSILMGHLLTYHFKNTYSPITLANISFINLVLIFRCSSSPNNPMYVRRVDFSDLVFSLSSHRHSYIGLVFSSRFLDS